MANFLVQTIDGQIKHDFSFNLLQAIEYQNWLHENSHTYVLIDADEMFEQDYRGCIPCGTVEFVHEYAKSYDDLTSAKPINIPKELCKLQFTKRSVFNYNANQLKSGVLHGKAFIKSMDVIKGFADIVSLDSSEIDLPNGNYQVSDVITIDSEWRCFVFNGELVGAKNYLGDFTMNPDFNLIREMMEAYKKSPKAYTIDVGVDKKETFVIEVHNIYSTGTYGFSKPSLLPQMFIAGYKHLVKNGY